MKKIYRSLLWLVTIGWLVPAYFSVESYLGYQREEVQAFIWQGPNKAVTSCPYLGLAESNFRISFFWFAAVFAGWSLYLITNHVLPKADHEDQEPISEGCVTRKPSHDPG